MVETSLNFFLTLITQIMSETLIVDEALTANCETLPQLQRVSDGFKMGFADSHWSTFEFCALSQ